MKSIADALGQAATQAPQPMQAAASNARSAFRLGTGTAWASGAEPVLTEMKPPAWMIRSKALRSTTRSLMTGNASARHGSMRDRRRRRGTAHVQLAGGGALRGRAPGRTVDHQAAHAADALAAVAVEGDRLLALGVELLVEDVEHLEERHVFETSADLVGDHLPSRPFPGRSCRQMLRVRFTCSSAASLDGS
jgi:hypothetical protein